MALIDLINEVDTYTTNYVDCPRCGGHKSLGITNQGEYSLYHCFKMGCDLRGKKYLHMSKERRKQLADREVAQATFSVPISWTYDVANSECYEYMRKSHIYDAYASGLFQPMYDIAQKRFVYPIVGDYGRIEGGVGRTLIKATPKVWNYHSACNRPFICGTGKKVVLVEDCASAVSVTRLSDTVGVALLGTSLKDSYVPYLRKLQPEVVYVALDADATKKTLTICRRLNNLFKKVVPIFLSKDIKDMEDIGNLYGQG